MTSQEFDSYIEGFNESNEAFISRVSSMLKHPAFFNLAEPENAMHQKIGNQIRNKIVENINSIVNRSYSEDATLQRKYSYVMQKLDEAIELDADEKSFLDAIRHIGLPFYVQEHSSKAEEFQIGMEYVPAISCRLVERVYIPDEAREFTAVHHWPASAEMYVYLPVRDKLPEDPLEVYPEPIPYGNDVFIKVIASGKEPVDDRSTLYALGPDYCYVHKPVGDSDAEMDFMLQDLTGFVDMLHLKNLSNEDLLEFLKKMVEHKVWPLKTFWPGVNASDIAS
jgi:hypothetical protein